MENKMPYVKDGKIYVSNEQMKFVLKDLYDSDIMHTVMLMLVWGILLMIMVGFLIAIDSLVCAGFVTILGLSALYNINKSYKEAYALREAIEKVEIVVVAEN